MSEIKNNIFPFGPYEGQTIENVCSVNCKYVRWIMVNIECFPEGHIEYDENMNSFMCDLKMYYNNRFNRNF
jgi:uncharacterized protein (DUF3820 family)